MDPRMDQESRLNFGVGQIYWAENQKPSHLEDPLTPPSYPLPRAYQSYSLVRWTYSSLYIGQSPLRFFGVVYTFLRYQP